MIPALLTALSLAHPSPPAGDDFVARLLRAHPDRFAAVLENAEAHRLQILVSEVVTDERGKASLARHGFRVDAEYFYPASAIESCAAVAAMLEVNRLHAEGLAEIDLQSPMRIHAPGAGDRVEEHDPTNRAGGTINLGHEIRKLFLVSDNRAFNRLYEFIGHRELNEWMSGAELDSVRIMHRLSDNRPPLKQRMTAKVDFLLKSGSRFTVEPRTSSLALDNEDLFGIRAGDAYVREEDGEIVKTPFSFLTRNSMSLTDLQDMQVMIHRPDIDVDKPGFALTDEQRDFLRRAMSEYPGQSANPIYDAETYPDHWVKLLLPGLVRAVAKEDLRVYNKVGRAYGFSVENAYVHDTRSDRGFFLTAVLYTNPNGVVNDGEYAYEEVADPFFANLGEVVAQVLWGEG